MRPSHHVHADRAKETLLPDEEELYFTLIEALQRMPAQTVERVISAAMRPVQRLRMLREWGQEMGPYGPEILILTNFPAKVTRFGVEASDEWHEWRDAQPFPKVDHPRLFRNKNGVLTCVCEPYELTHEELQDLVDFCCEHHLDMTVGIGSEHFFTGCLLVTFKPKKDRDNDQENINQTQRCEAALLKTENIEPDAKASACP